MRGAVDDPEALRLGHPEDRRFDRVARAVLVLGGLDDRLRFAGGRQEPVVEHLERQTDAEELLHPGVARPDRQADPRAEREPRDPERQRRMARAQEVDRVAGIVLFADPLGVAAGRGADAAKIEPQRRHAPVDQRLRQPIDDVVVHRSAAARVGVADHGRGHRRRRLAHDRLQLSVRHRNGAATRRRKRLRHLRPNLSTAARPSCTRDFPPRPCRRPRPPVRPVHPAAAPFATAESPVCFLDKLVSLTFPIHSTGVPNCRGARPRRFRAPAVAVGVEPVTARAPAVTSAGNPAHIDHRGAMASF